METDTVILKQQISSLHDKLTLLKQQLEQAEYAAKLLSAHQINPNVKLGIITSKHHTTHTAKRFFNEIIKVHKNPRSATKFVVNAVLNSQPKTVSNALIRLIQQFLDEQSLLLKNTESTLISIKKRLQFHDKLAANGLIQQN